MQAAREMAAVGCDIVVLGGVPINLSRGFQTAQAMIDDLEGELGIKVSTSQRAQTRVSKALGAILMLCFMVCNTGVSSSDSRCPAASRSAPALLKLVV
jgi:hypothetical protein